MGQYLQPSKTTEGQQKNMKGCLLLLDIVMRPKCGLAFARIQPSFKSMEDSLWILGGSRRGFGVARRSYMAHFLLASAQETPAMCSSHQVFTHWECLGKVRQDAQGMQYKGSLRCNLQGVAFVFCRSLYLCKLVSAFLEHTDTNTWECCQVFFFNFTLFIILILEA